MKKNEMSALRKRLHVLGLYLPQLEAPGFCFGAWEHPPGGFPYYSYGETACALEAACYATGWMLEGFDWPIWKETEEACHLRDDPAYLTNANPEQLARLLTTLIRQDRFCEGAFAEAYECGLLTAIVRRAAMLATELPSESNE